MKFRHEKPLCISRGQKHCYGHTCWNMVAPHPHGRTTSHPPEAKSPAATSTLTSITHRDSRRPSKTFSAVRTGCRSPRERRALTPATLSARRPSSDARPVASHSGPSAKAWLQADGGTMWVDRSHGLSLTADRPGSGVVWLRAARARCCGSGKSRRGSWHRTIMD